MSSDEFKIKTAGVGRSAHNFPATVRNFIEAERRIYASTN